MNPPCLKSTFRMGIFAGLLVMVSNQRALAEEFLIKDGRANAEIVVSDQAVRMIRLAAEQLQTSLAEMTDAKLPIVTVPGSAAVKVYVGSSRWTDELGLKVDDLEHDAYRMGSGKNWLALLGRDIPFFQQRGKQATELLRLAALKPGDPKTAELWSRWYALSGGKWGLPYNQLWKSYNKALDIWAEDEHGSFNAVAGFLRSLGMRWYMPGPLGRVVPKHASVALPKVDKKVEADFPVRFANHMPFGDRDEALWELWMGLNRAAEILDPDFPQHGINAIIETRTEHSLYAHPGAMPPKPDDYYALYGSERQIFGKVLHGKPTGSKPCLSCPGLLADSIRYVLARAQFLQSSMVSMMLTDAYMSVCQCELCKGKDNPELGTLGVLSNYEWGFVDRVAREVYKTNPNLKILGTSYGTYRLPPTAIEKFSPNVVVCICQHRQEFGQRPDEKANYVGLRKPFLAKLPPGKSLLIYEYYRGTRHTPHYSPHVIAEDLRALKGICLGDMIDVTRDSIETYKKDGYTLLTRMSVQHLDLYVTGRCLWDANLDIDALLEEYYREFYGPAAAEMKAVVQFGEANWMDIVGNKEKIDTTLRLLKAVQDKVDPQSVYGKRVALIADYLRPLERLREQGKIERVNVPELIVGDRTGEKIVIDGKLDEPFWQKVHMWSKGTLKDMATGGKPKFGTRFMVGWLNDNLYFGIRCEEAKGQSPNVTATQHDQLSMWEGDCIELELEPPGHSYYQIAVSPSGAVTDMDWSLHKATRVDWDSHAEVATQVGDGYWTVEMRIPVAGAEQVKILPLEQVAGNRPTEAFPWYFNLCRQRTRGEQQELTGFSPTGKGFHVPEKFAKLWVGRKKPDASKKVWPAGN
jgi:hypothetical protein